jgi:ATP-binding cassette, subfamily B, multidrug efflux pump
VAKSASFHDEAGVMPQGYETVIGERGITLSGGQKQRVSIARALMRDAPVLVLDDCLSAVDANTEREIFHNLLSFIRHRTTVLVTHRVSAAAEFDRILVLHQGEMVELGTHEELMRQGGYYRAMVELQNRGENLLAQ